MDHSEQMRLMHEVLDGAASPGEVQELDRLLSTDPSARALFEDLRRLFDCLKAMPKERAPEGMVDAVLARMPRRSTALRGLRQLSSRWRVFSTSSTGGRGNSRTTGTGTRRVTRYGTSKGNQHMSDQKSGFSSKRWTWVGAGTAAVVIFLAGRYIEFPPKADSTSGTIAPAVRYRADQPGASDVKVGEQSGSTQGVQENVANDAAAHDAAAHDAAAHDAAAHDAAAHDAAAHDAAAHDAAAHDAAAHDAAAHDAAAHDAAAHDAAAHDAAAHEAAAHDAAAHEAQQ